MSGDRHRVSTSGGALFLDTDAAVLAQSSSTRPGAASADNAARSSDQYAQQQQQQRRMRTDDDTTSQYSSDGGDAGDVDVDDDDDDDDAYRFQQPAYGERADDDAGGDAQYDDADADGDEESEDSIAGAPVRGYDDGEGDDGAREGDDDARARDDDDDAADYDDEDDSAAGEQRRAQGGAGADSGSAEGSERSGSDESSMLDEDLKPRFKYSRVGERLTQLLVNETARCMAVHSKFLVLGAASGRVFVLDYEGRLVKQLMPHALTVQDLCVDAAGETIATCSDDGKVVLYNIATDDHSSATYSRPLRCVALSDAPGSRRDPVFVCGGLAGQLVLSKKGRLMGRSEVVLQAGEGPIHGLAWRGSMLAWANDEGVKVLDTEANERIAYIQRPSQSPPPSQFRCHLVWENESTLIVAWGNFIKIGELRERDLRVPNLPSREMRLVLSIRTDFWLCGVAPLDEDSLLVLGYPCHVDMATYGYAPQVDPGYPPEVRVISRSQRMELFCDVLSVDVRKDVRANDYRLCYFEPDRTFFVVTPHDVIQMQCCDADDDIEWLVRKGRLRDAFEETLRRERELTRTRRVDIGSLWLQQLFEAGDYEQVVRYLPTVLQKDVERWTFWVSSLSAAGRTADIALAVPTEVDEESNVPLLPARTYDLVLFNLISTNEFDLAVKVVRRWNPQLYTPLSHIDLISKRLRPLQGISASSATEHAIARQLTRVLAELYNRTEHFDLAFGTYLNMHDKSVFKLIERHRDRLRASVLDQVLALLHLDIDATLKLLTAEFGVTAANAVQVAPAERNFPVELVVSKLGSDERLKFIYLDSVSRKSMTECQKFHKEMIRLYAKFEPERMERFLRSDPQVDLDDALLVCRAHHLQRETVYVLERLGNHVEALDMILRVLHDVPAAVAYCREHNQTGEMWDQLLDRCIEIDAEGHSGPDGEGLVSELLTHIGGNMDPLQVIERLPLGLRIPRLADKLAHIIADHHLLVSLSETCHTLLNDDCAGLMDSVVHAMRKPLAVRQYAVCQSCRQSIFNLADSSEAVLMFACGHQYHRSCLHRSYDQQRVRHVCILCKPHATRSSAGASARASMRVPGGLPGAR